MSELNLNVDMGNVLQPPNLDALGAPEVVAKQQGSTLIKDTMSTSTTLTTTLNLLADNPTPTEPTKLGLETLAQLGTSPSTTGPKGLGNPWLAGSPTTAFKLAFMEFFNILRQSKSEMGEMLAQQVGMTMDLAKSAAELVIASSKKESEEHIANAIVAGVQMGVSLVGAAIATAAAIKAARPSQEMKDASKDVETAKTNKANTNQKSVEELDAQYQTKQLELNSNKAQIAKMDKDGTAGTDGTKVTERGNLQDANKKIEADMTQIQKDIDAKKLADKNLSAAEDRFKSAEGRHLGAISRLNEISQPAIQALNRAADLAGSLLKADIAIAKGLINAEQQILQGQQEVLRKLNETISQSYNNTSDAMNQLIQALKKMEDELVRAMSMTRN